MSMDEWMVIGMGLALAGIGGALGAALTLGVCWRRLQQGAAGVLEERLAPQLAALRQEQQRMPQSVQQALQVELEFHVREQSERDARHAAELREFLRAALAAYGWSAAPPMPPVPAPESVAPVWPPAAGPGVAPPLRSPDNGAAGTAEAGSPRAWDALSDAEIDALPADLPPPSRRVKPPLRPPAGIPVKRL